LHQGEQPAEPGGPPRDPGRRQAPQGLRQGQGHHVRDEQAPRPAPEV
ncbi:MAG: SWIB/MDM2 domain-containing proteins, partial [uncultured Thermomicrobiales bacterium]